MHILIKRALALKFLPKRRGLQLFPKQLSGIETATAQDESKLNTLLESCKIEKAPALIPENQAKPTSSITAINPSSDVISKFQKMVLTTPLDDCVQFISNSQEHTPVKQLYVETLLHYINNKQDLDTIFSVYDRFVKEGVNPSISILITLLKGCLMHRNAKRASLVFDYIQREIAEPTKECYDILIGTFAFNGEAEAALEKLDEMKAAGLFPDSATYNAVIRTCAHRADYYKVCFDMFEQMVTAGFEPDSFTYQSLLTATAKNGDFDRAMLLWQSASSNLKLNIHILNALLKAFAHSLVPQYWQRLRLVNGEGSLSPNQYVATKYQIMLEKSELELSEGSDAADTECESAKKKRDGAVVLSETTRVLKEFFSSEFAAEIPGKKTRNSFEKYNLHLRDMSLEQFPYAKRDELVAPWGLRSLESSELILKELQTPWIVKKRDFELSLNGERLNITNASINSALADRILDIYCSSNVYSHRVEAFALFDTLYEQLGVSRTHVAYDRLWQLCVKDRKIMERFGNEHFLRIMEWSNVFEHALKQLQLSPAERQTYREKYGHTAELWFQRFSRGINGFARINQLDRALDLACIAQNFGSGLLLPDMSFRSVKTLVAKAMNERDDGNRLYFKRLCELMPQRPKLDAYSQAKLIAAHRRGTLASSNPSWGPKPPKSASPKAELELVRNQRAQDKNYKAMVKSAKAEEALTAEQILCTKPHPNFKKAKRV